MCLRLGRGEVKGVVVGGGVATSGVVAGQIVVVGDVGVDGGGEVVVGVVAFVVVPRSAKPAASAAVSAKLIGMGERLLEVVGVVVGLGG